ncbi:hypothetical protein LCGC14_0249740 [marine sediment metagenome]|uniref:Uncharacterized protein n=1 Tax=marine sediment metagenome TaxID=412755 RepID=A0A0F9WQD5_9ZZZZ
MSNTKTREEIVKECANAAIGCWEHYCDRPLSDIRKALIETRIDVEFPHSFSTVNWTAYADQRDKELAEEELQDETPET